MKAKESMNMCVKTNKHTDEYIPFSPVYPELQMQSISASLPKGDVVWSGQDLSHSVKLFPMPFKSLYFPTQWSCARERERSCESIRACIHIQPSAGQTTNGEHTRRTLATWQIHTWFAEHTRTSVRTSGASTTSHLANVTIRRPWWGCFAYLKSVWLELVNDRIVQTHNIVNDTCTCTRTRTHKQLILRQLHAAVKWRPVTLRRRIWPSHAYKHAQTPVIQWRTKWHTYTHTHIYIRTNGDHP